MARKLENYLPPIREDGIVTDKALYVMQSTGGTGGGALRISLGSGSAAAAVYVVKMFDCSSIGSGRLDSRGGIPTRDIAGIVVVAGALFFSSSS